MPYAVLTHLGNQATDVERFSKSVRVAEAKKQAKPGPRLPTASLFAFLGSKVSSCFKFMLMLLGHSSIGWSSILKWCIQVNALEATDSQYAHILQKVCPFAPIAILLFQYRGMWKSGDALAPPVSPKTNMGKTLHLSKDCQTDSPYPEFRTQL